MSLPTECSVFIVLLFGHAQVQKCARRGKGVSGRLWQATCGDADLDFSGFRALYLLASVEVTGVVWAHPQFACAPVRMRCLLDADGVDGSPALSEPVLRYCLMPSRHADHRLG